MPGGPHLLAAVSGHGYGHLAQVAPVVNRLRQLQPDLRLTVMSELPYSVLHARLDGDFVHLANGVDAVMRMHSAWQVDVPASCRAWREFHHDWITDLGRELERLRKLGPDLVLADIPYRLLLAARQAGIPAVALCSLNWAAIHAAYCHGDAGHAAIGAQMHAGYAAAEQFLAPTPALPMPELDNVCAIGPIARTGRNRRDEILAFLKRSGDTRLVLMALGGIDSPRTISDWPRMDGVVWLCGETPHSARADLVDFTRLSLPFIDLLASVDAVFTKPGYGTYAEAVCNATPLLTLARPDWPETPYLNAWAAAHGRVLEIKPAVFQRGAFAGALDALWAQPAPTTVPSPSGIDDAADRLLDFF